LLNFHKSGIFGRALEKGDGSIFLEENAISRVTWENKAVPLAGKEGDRIEEIF